MPKSKEQKQKTVEELNANLNQAKSVVFANIQGLKAKDLVALRRRVKEAKGVFKIAKKTLIDLALKGKKTELSAKNMDGEVGILFGLEDPISALKSLYAFSKEHESLKFIAGIFEDSFLEQAQVMTLAQLPSRNELLAQLLGSLNSPMTGLASVLQGNIKGLVYILAQKAKT